MNSNTVNIPAGHVHLKGDLTIPVQASSIVIFSHGSGSSRLSPRNIHVARILQQAGHATLLFDLLSEEEDSTAEARFNIDLLTERLIHVIEWLTEKREYNHLVPMIFGASTGAASALRAAAILNDLIWAVVSRGGRPDLTGDILKRVTAPTLLIVGELDFSVLNLNRNALQKMQCEKMLAVIPGASHLFEEPGKLDEVAKLASEWFGKHKYRKLLNKQNKLMT
jgi:putative phosphoribosyl transferase